MENESAKENLHQVFIEKTASIQEAGRKPGMVWWQEILVFIAVFFAALMLQSYSDVVLVRAFKITDTTIQSLCELLTTSIPMAIFILYAMIVQKRPLSSLGYAVKGVNVKHEYLIGLAIGAGLMALAVIGQVLVGVTSFTGIAISALPMMFLFFLGYMFQGMQEELICRGYLLVSISRRNPVWAGILINAGLFAAMHLANPGVTAFSTINTMLFGVFASICFLRRDSIWMAGAIHSAWNFAQSNIFQQRTSGNPVLPSLLTMKLPTVDNILSGGNYGVEGSIFTTLVYLIGIIILLILPAVHRDSSIQIANPAEPAAPAAGQQ